MRRHPWPIVALLALAGVLVLGLFPMRAYLQQSHQREQLAARAASLAADNRDLTDQANQLQSDAAVEQLARDKYELVKPGEEAYSILPDGSAPANPATAGALPTRPASPVAPPPAPAKQGLVSRLWARVTSIF